MRTTKIMATLGPASNTPDILDQLIDHGVDVVRINMSHGTHAEHADVLTALRAITDRRRVHVARVADLCGPKVRTGVIDQAAGEIARGDLPEEVVERACLTNHADSSKSDLRPPPQRIGCEANGGM